MKSDKITDRRKTFAEKVAEGHTATEAYLLAGYRVAKRETAHRAASRLYSNPGIRAYIRELRRTGDELAREETSLTIAKKLAFLARLVLTSSATLLEDDPLIQSHRLLKDGSLSIRMPCKLKALKMHSELAGHFLPEPKEQPDPIDPLQELFDQIRKGTGAPTPTTGATSNPHKQTKPPNGGTCLSTLDQDAPQFSEGNTGLRAHPVSSARSPKTSLNEPAPSPKDADILPATDGRAGTSGDADLSPHNQPSSQNVATPTDDDSLTKLEGRDSLSEGTHIPISESVSTKTALTSSMAGGKNKNSDPQQTTTFPSEPAEPEAPQCGPAGPHWPLAPSRVATPNNSPLHPLPSTPLQVRKMVIAQLQQSSPIHHLYSAPKPDDPPRPLVILR